MQLRETFATNLRRRRNECGLSQERLADLAEIDRTYVSLLERCIYAVSIDVLEKLAAALDIEPADLLKQAVEAESKGRKKSEGRKQ